MGLRSKKQNRGKFLGYLIEYKNCLSVMVVFIRKSDNILVNDKAVARGSATSCIRPNIFPNQVRIAL